MGIKPKILETNITDYYVDITVNTNLGIRVSERAIKLPLSLGIIKIRRLYPSQGSIRGQFIKKT